MLALLFDSLRRQPRHPRWAAFEAFRREAGPGLERQALFDALPDVVFFLKDAHGRYTHANLTLVHRLGLARREDLVGRTPALLFPPKLGSAYAGQDNRVLGVARRRRRTAMRQ